MLKYCNLIREQYMNPEYIYQVNSIQNIIKQIKPIPKNKYILESKYGKKITKMCLVCLHPNNASKTYEVHEVQNLEKEIADLMELRRQQVEEEKTKTI